MPNLNICPESLHKASPKELERLAVEIRRKIIETVAKSGDIWAPALE